MSALTFPTFPLVAQALSRSEMYTSSLQTALSGMEWRSTWQATPRYRYTISIELLRQFGSFTEVASILTFFETHRGRWDSFLFVDPYDGATRRVRFDDDSLSLDREGPTYWSATRINLISVL